MLFLAAAAFHLRIVNLPLALSRAAKPFGRYVQMQQPGARVEAQAGACGWRCGWRCGGCCWRALREQAKLRSANSRTFSLFLTLTFELPDKVRSEQLVGRA